MNINIIGVPLFYGSDRKGVDLGPDTIREMGVINLLEKHHHDVKDLGNVNVPIIPESEKYASHSKMKYFNAIVDVNAELAETVDNTMKDHRFPFIVGGDHALGLGSISGVAEHANNLAVIWVDAHGDINTSETTNSGNVHGMPLAAAMGFGHTELLNIHHAGIKVKPENVIIIGARDLDAGEVDLIEKQKLDVYTTNDVRERGIAKVMNQVLETLKEKNIDAVHLSFDIDCIDSAIVPGTGTPVADGMTVDEAKYLLKSLMESGFIKSMDFVELNSSLDESGNTTNLCMDLIDWTFSYLK